MSRETFVYRNGKLVNKEHAPPLYESRSAPGIITDTMDPTWHPINGKHYDSKRAFRQVTKDAGCIEVGDQKGFGGRKFVPRLSKEKRAHDIKRAIEELRAR